MANNHLTQYSDYSNTNDIQYKVKDIQKRLMRDVKRYESKKLPKNKVSKDINNLRRAVQQQRGTQHSINAFNRFITDQQSYIQKVTIFSHSYSNPYNYGIGIYVYMNADLLKNLGNDVTKLRKWIRRYKEYCIQIKSYVRLFNSPKGRVEVRLNNSPNQIHSISEDDIKDRKRRGKIPKNSITIQKILDLSSDKERKQFIQRLK